MSTDCKPFLYKSQKTFLTIIMKYCELHLIIHIFCQVETPVICDMGLMELVQAGLLWY